jgi:hypothetical protein
LFVDDTLEKPGSEGNQLEVPPSNDPVEQPANENPATRQMATQMPMKVCFWSANCIEFTALLPPLPNIAEVHGSPKAHEKVAHEKVVDKKWPMKEGQ